uniref:Uncharacterized protein n=1 Tax=Magallana gigas TaxID=29159 RepID=K1Q991_MAGGI
MGVVIHTSIIKKPARYCQWSRTIQREEPHQRYYKVDKIVTTATVQKDFRFMPSEQRPESSGPGGIDENLFS